MKSCKMLVVIADIAKFAINCRNLSEEKIFMLLDRFYQLVERSVQAQDGRVVKFMGDSALMIFDEDQHKSAEKAIDQIQQNAPLLFNEFGIKCHVKFKSDTCSLVCGEMGLQKRFDIVGNDLNNLFLKDFDS